MSQEQNRIGKRDKYAALVEEWSQKQMTKGHPLVQATLDELKEICKKSGNETLSSDGVSWENCDDYCRLWFKCDNKRHGDSIIFSIDSFVRAYINNIFGYPIKSKAYFLTKESEANPFTGPVVGVYLLTKEKAIDCEARGGGDLRAHGWQVLLDAGAVLLIPTENGVLEVEKKKTKL
jgi:hypothetical protein